MDAVVDEARVALLAEAAGLALADEVGQARLAGAAVAPGAAGRRQLADRRDVAVADDRGELLARLLAARAQVGRLLGRARALDLQQLGDDRLAGAAAGAGARDRDDLLGRAEPAARGSRRRSRPCRRRCSCRPARRRAARRPSPARPRRAARAGRRPRGRCGRRRCSSSAPRVSPSRTAPSTRAVGVGDELAVRAAPRRRRRRPRARPRPRPR